MRIFAQNSFFIVILLHKVLANCPPVYPRKGLEIRCLSPERHSIIDCSQEIPEGAEVQYRCRKFYRNFDALQQGGHLTCAPQGRLLRFLEFQEFRCHPECGHTSNATLDTLSSYIEREHETGDTIFPWHAAIFKRFGQTDTFRYFCGSTLVNPDNKGFFLLTAAHCVSKNRQTSEPAPVDSFRVVLGALSKEFDGNVAGSSQIFTPKKIVIEREYDPRTLQSNIAMIELNGPVKVSDTVQPVCFPTRTIANSQVRPGVYGEIPAIRDLQLTYQHIMKVPISEQGECLRGCSRVPTITEFCAIHTLDAQLTPLDSGTGIVFSDGNSPYFLQGILAKVAGEADGCDKHDTFTSVSVFTDWVHKVHEDFSESQNRDEVIVSPPPTSRPTFPPPNSITDRPIFPPRSTAPPQLPPSEILRLGLDLHNYYRKMHNAPPLRLSNKLSQEAQEWAEYLLLENKWEFSEGKVYSENIFQYFGRISDYDVMQKAVENWYNAKNKYNWNSPEASTFSQVVWRSTSEIGIGVASKGTKSVVVTNYYPKGNLYDTGDRGKYFRDNVLPLVLPKETVSLV